MNTRNGASDMVAQNYLQIIRLISYPGATYHNTTEAVFRAQAKSLTVKPSLDEFYKYVQDAKLTDLQEQFTQTFDLSPATCLDLGWHLYGENYGRGVFMVRMRQLLRANGIKESTELPDHLSHIMAVLPSLNNNDGKALIESYVLPALDKVLKGFKDSDNPFQSLIRFIQDLLKDRIELQRGAI